MSGYQHQMQPVRCLLAQTPNNARRVALGLQPVEVVDDQNDVFAQHTAQPDTDSLDRGLALACVQPRGTQARRGHRHVGLQCPKQAGQKAIRSHLVS